jgi:Carboxypeptidase regulatory-like domain
MKYSLLSLIVLLLPGAVFAQATLTGTVRTDAGAVLPGVAVEAASPALGDKSRSAITNATGQYTIAGLPSGTYSLTFRLSGFTTIKREGIELSGTDTVTIPIAMRFDLTSLSLASPAIVCGMTVMPPADVDPRMRQDVPAGGPTPLIRKVVPGVCVSKPAMPKTAPFPQK